MHGPEMSEHHAIWGGLPLKSVWCLSKKISFWVPLTGKIASYIKYFNWARSDCTLHACHRKQGEIFCISKITEWNVISHLMTTIWIDHHGGHF